MKGCLRNFELDVGLIAHNETEEIKKFQNLLCVSLWRLCRVFASSRTKHRSFFRRLLLLSNMETSPQGLFFYLRRHYTERSCFEREFMSTLNALDLKKEKPGIMALLKKNLIILFPTFTHRCRKLYVIVVSWTFITNRVKLQFLGPEMISTLKLGMHIIKNCILVVAQLLKDATSKKDITLTFLMKANATIIIFRRGRQGCYALSTTVLYCVAGAAMQSDIKCTCFGFIFMKYDHTPLS